ncbi:MAG: carbohydrate binding domain-containing protein [Armatimonadetes bacterium]|nr:carbohydrate binding domain-containing protein [Armatimonadota bacterium]
MLEIKDRFGVVLTSVILLAVVCAANAGGSGDNNDIKDANLLKNGGFENGLTTPWGTGQYSELRPLWWNAGECKSTVDTDETIKKSGLASLYIYNPTPKKPNTYGTMAQRVAVKKNHIYRLTLWAKGNALASRGAVSIIVDPTWKVRSINLPAGSFSWKKFSTVFSLPTDYADVRILSEDQGEAWIDDIRVEALDNYLREPASEGK